MQPGTLNHTTASAIAKVLKEKGGLNTLVQADRRRIGADPDGGRGEVDLGMANMLEVGRRHRDRQAAERPAHHRLDLRAAHRLLRAQGQRHRRTMADLKGKRVPTGYSAMRTLDTNVARDAGDRRT